MDAMKRKLINDNIEELANTTKNFDRLLKELIKRKMFNGYMENEILTEERQSDKDKMIYLYEYITTRGPNAFEDLKNSLIQSGNRRAASLLKGARPIEDGDEEEEDSDKDDGDNSPGGELTVVQSLRRMDGDWTQAYKMGSRPKGHALIINIRSYVNNILDEREGSEQDVRALQNVLPQLGYKTHTLQNEELTRREFGEELNKFVRNPEHQNCDSSLVVIMGHGTTDMSSNLIKVICYDGQDMYLHDVIDMFSAERCPGLANKPKMFFVQVCRGGMPHARVSLANGNGAVHGELQTDGGENASDSLVRNYADILIGHATIRGYVSHRDTVSGSWFIQALCRVLAKFSHNTDLSTMLEKVDFNVSRIERHPIFTQTTEPLSSLSKKLYFNPGLYDDIGHDDDQRHS